MNINELLAVIEKELDQPLWNNWYLKERIGTGAFSGVYRIEARRTSRTDVSALKIEPITVGDNTFYDEERKKNYINYKRSLVENESTIMYKLRNCPYIVTYEDEDMQELIIDGKNEGYYFLIRMEYLICIENIIRKKQMDLSERNILKLAADIGKGIKAAHDIGVIHRDIKPPNFFVSDNGVYKLGDFNVSKQSDTARTFAGTSGYLAPEIYRAKANADESYTGQADIYSFGICLYQFMNDMYFPFEENCFADEAISRRMSGEKLPKPKNASEAFSRIILKACAFSPEERYLTIGDMLRELDELSAAANSQAQKENVSVTENNGFAPQDTVFAAEDTNTGETNTFLSSEETSRSGYDDESNPFISHSSREEAVPAEKTSGKKVVIIAVIIALLVCGIVSFVIFSAVRAKKKREFEKHLRHYVHWDSDDMFFIDYSLLGQSFSSICDELDVDLDPPENWKAWGDSLQYTEYDGFDKPSVVFLFKDDKCIKIYNDLSKSDTSAVRSDIISHYGGERAYITEGECYFSASDVIHNDDGQKYFRQSYSSEKN